MVLEYMDHGSLADCLTAHGPLPEPVLSSITKTLLGGLKHLHQQLRIVHRDIKPGNILLNSAGQAKLADFGMSGQLANTLSHLASWVGTAAYMSPERISGGSYSFDSDLWSLGLSLWECSMGLFPYGDAGERLANGPPPTEEDSLDDPGRGVCFWELLHQIVEADSPQLPSGRFSPAFCTFVHQCMRKETTERPTASELLLHPWLTECPGTEALVAEWLATSEKARLPQ